MSSSNPKNPFDPFLSLRVGDVVIVPDHRLGVVRYIGTVDFTNDNKTYAGIELKGHTDEQNGCNGTRKGRTYFKTKHPNAGIFVEKITRIIPPEEILKKVAELNEKLLLCTCDNGKNDNYGGEIDNEESSSEEDAPENED